MSRLIFDGRTIHHRVNRCCAPRLHKVCLPLALLFITLNFGLYRRFKARLNPPSPTTDSSKSPHLPEGPKKDYSLKDGQTFSIAIPGRNRTTNIAGGLFSDTAAKTETSSSSGSAVPLLPPPPSSRQR